MSHVNVEPMYIPVDVVVRVSLRLGENVPGRSDVWRFVSRKVTDVVTAVVPYDSPGRGKGIPERLFCVLHDRKEVVVNEDANVVKDFL